PASLASVSCDGVDARDAHGRRHAGVHGGYGGRLRDGRAAARQQLLGIAIAVHVDALVRAIPAGDVAEVAADTFLGVNARHDFVIQVELVPIRHSRQAQTAKIVDGTEAFFVHPVAQTVDHVLHDAI